MTMAVVIAVRMSISKRTNKKCESELVSLFSNKGTQRNKEMNGKNNQHKPLCQRYVKLLTYSRVRFIRHL